MIQPFEDFDFLLYAKVFLPNLGRKRPLGDDLYGNHLAAGSFEGFVDGGESTLPDLGTDRIAVIAAPRQRTGRSTRGVNIASDREMALVVGSSGGGQQRIAHYGSHIPLLPALDDAGRMAAQTKRW